VLIRGSLIPALVRYYRALKSRYEVIADKSIRPKHFGEILDAQKQKSLGANDAAALGSPANSDRGPGAGSQ